MCKFGWNEWCHYFDDSKVSMFLFQKSYLGRVLGPAKNKGINIDQWILKYNGKIIPRHMVKNIMGKHLDQSNAI